MTTSSNSFEFSLVVSGGHKHLNYPFLERGQLFGIFTFDFI
jgi:hypothetical protein